MKKIILFLVVCFLISSKHVNASPVSWDYIPGVYSNRYLDGKIYSGPIGYAYLDGNLVYCIDPYIGSGVEYTRNDSILSKFTPADLNYLSLVAHYAKQYQPQNPYYFLAAQELIWRRATGGNNVTFSTGYKEGGAKIDVSGYKQVLEDIVIRELQGPKFDTYEIRGDVFSTTTLLDSNSVLEHYEIKNESSHKVVIDGGILKIKILDDKESFIELTRKIDGEHMGFVSPNGQDLAYFNGFQKTIRLKIVPTNSYSEKIQIIHTYHDNPISSFFTFQIFDVSNQTFIKRNGTTLFQTSEDGKFLSNFTLPRGTYELIDVSAVNPFLSGSRISFQIDQLHEDGISDIFLEVDSPLGTVHYNRYQNLYNKKSYPVPNVCYFLYPTEEIYGPDGEWLHPIGGYLGFTCTDHNGFLEFNDIPLGEYELVEDFDPTKQNYIYDNQKIPISVQYKDDHTKDIIINSQKTIDYQQFNIHLGSYQETFLGIINQIAMYEMIPSNVEYGLYADQVLLFNEELWSPGDLITLFPPLEDGYQKMNIPLPKGSYYIMPILGGKKIYFQVDEDNTISIEYYHELEKGTIKVEVINELNIPLSNQKFMLLDGDIPIFHGITNKNGLIEIKNLPCGYYQLFDEEINKKSFFSISKGEKTIQIKRTSNEEPSEEPDEEPNEELEEEPNEESEEDNSTRPVDADNSSNKDPITINPIETKILPKTTKSEANQLSLGLFGVLILIYVINKYF